MPENDAMTGLELVDQFECESGDFAEVLLYVAGPDPFPVRLAVADEDERATAWMTADEAESVGHRLIGVAERARREGKQALGA